jgi:hypothetical protein
MYSSINNVVPIDPDKAGKSLADYLNSYGQVTFFALIALAIVSLIVAIVIAKKAGYSGWWGAIAVLFPPAGLVLVLLLALFKWPALKERDEALGVLASHEMTLPSHERKAIKEAERKRAIEDAARKRMEKAQAEREKADAERERFAAAEAKRAADASVVAAAAAKAAAAPVGSAVVTRDAATKTADVVSGTAGSSTAGSSTAGSSTAAPDGAAGASDGRAQTRAAAPLSVAPKMPTTRPRTSTNKTTVAANEPAGTVVVEPAAPSEG